MEIEITAAAATGKSAVAFALSEWLESMGAKVTVTGCEDEPPEVIEGSWEDRATAALRGAEITIKTTRSTEPVPRSYRLPEPRGGWGFTVEGGK